MKLSVLTTAGIWSNSLTPKYLWAKWEQNLLLQNKTLSSNLCKYISLFNRLGFLLFIWTMVSFYQPLLYFRQCLMMQFFLTKTHLWLPPKTVRVTQRYLRGQIWEKKKKKSIQPFSSVHSSYSCLSLLFILLILTYLLFTQQWTKFSILPCAVDYFILMLLSWFWSLGSVKTHPTTGWGQGCPLPPSACPRCLGM